VTRAFPQAPPIEWSKCYGGLVEDQAFSVQQTSDGGYIVAGSAGSIDGDVTGHHGSPFNDDCWIVKLNSNGVIDWEKAFGGSQQDRAYSIVQTFDGGYVFTGYTQSNDGDVTGNHGHRGFTDIWVVKIDSTGAILWERSLGGTANDIGNCIRQT